MIQQIELSSELKLELVDWMGGDLSVVNAARVSLNQHEDEMNEKNAGLINYLMKNKHASPFEHCQVSIRVEAPIVVVREWHRHRSQSYNEVSGRYTELKPKFYMPDCERPLIQTGKPGAYLFEVPEDEELYIETHKEFRFASQTAWNAYQYLLGKGVAKEVARMVLPVNIYTMWYATMNLRNAINFLALRTDVQAMYEIRTLADGLEALLTEKFPVTMETWQKNGRQSI